MRRPGASSTSEWIDIFSLPSSVAKRGISQGSFRISSLLASGRMKRVEPTVSNSTTLVILTRPTFQCMRCVPMFLLWRRNMRVSAPERNGSSGAMRRYRGNPGGAMPELAISAEKVAFIIEKAREFDVKETDADPDSGSNATDDDMIDVLEDNGSDPVGRELSGFITALNEDEQLDLVALTWLGRGEGTIDDWDELRARAVDARAAYRAPRRETVRYLLGDPMLGDLLADGLDAFGIDWT